MRNILSCIETYQSARSSFVQTIAEMCSRPQNIEVLQNSDILSLLRPLLLDTVPSIQQSAALALGRLANYSEALAANVVSSEVLPQLVYSLAEQNRFYKKTACYVLKSIAKHSASLAQSVVDAGALEPLVGCLSEFEPSVKESAAWALGYIAQHTPELAQSVVDSGAVPQLVLCLQEPELSLKRIAASTLSEICKHSPELAQIIVDAGAIPYLSSFITHPDVKLKQQINACLSQISKHSVDLAEVVVESEIFPRIFLCLKENDNLVKRNAATCIREVSKHTPELAQLIVNSGGHTALVQFLSQTKGATRLPAIMTLGYIAAFSETLAKAIISVHGIIPLKDALLTETEDHIRAAAIWSLGQLGKHTAEHAEYIAKADLLRVMVDVYKDPKSSDDLKTKAQRALKNVMQKCTYLSAFEPLLKDAPEKILKYIMQQLAKILPHNPSARKSFVQSRSLQRIQEIAAQDTTNKLHEYIVTINACFPQEIVQYYSPNYAETLLKKLEEQ